MNDKDTLGRLAVWYMQRAGWIGALYGIIPAVLWFGGAFAMLPFRSVYLVRLVLSVVIAGVFGWFFNQYGMKLWLLKHRSPEGPATVADGMIVGAGIGLAIAFFPPFTALIGTNHLEEAKWFIIGAWLAAALCGLVIGGVLATIGCKHVERNPDAARPK